MMNSTRIVAGLAALAIAAGSVAVSLRAEAVGAPLGGAKTKRLTDAAKAASTTASRTRDPDVDRLSQTPLLRLASIEAGTPRGTTLLQEWRDKSTVEGLTVTSVPGPQVQLDRAATARIVGAFRYPMLNPSLLFPAVYLSEYGFDKILLFVEPQWPLEWYRRLLEGVGDRSLLVVFDSPMGEPDFDGIKAFLEEFGAKVWAVTPAGRLASNGPVWANSFPGVTITKPGHELTIDTEYARTMGHIQAVTNYINLRWAELPVCVFFSENRYTNTEFAQALKFTPSAILLSDHVKYDWGSGQLSPSPGAASRFRISARQALAQHVPAAPIILHGQVFSYRRSGLTASETDTRLKQEAASVFDDARDQGCAAACLILE